MDALTEHFTRTQHHGDHIMYSHNRKVYIHVYSINDVKYYNERINGDFTGIQLLPNDYTFPHAILSKDNDITKIVDSKMEMYENRCKIANIPINGSNIERILAIMGFGYTEMGWTLYLSNATLDIEDHSIRNKKTGKSFPYTIQGLRELVSSLV